MEISQIQTKSTKASNALGDMDARTLARLARVNIGTFNVWAHRGLLPGLDTGVRGRRRNIEPAAATGIVIFAELVRAGFGPDDASRMVAAMRDHLPNRGFLVVPTPKFDNEGKVVAGGVIHCRDAADAAATIQNPRLPPVIVLINVRDLSEQARRAEDEWLARRGGQPDG